MTDVTDAGTEPDAGADSGESKQRRGRPRPQDTINRDEQVADLLTKGKLTREEIATKLGIESSQAYLSLFRLKKAGRVARGESVPAAEGEESAGRRTSTWQLVSDA